MQEEQFGVLCAAFERWAAELVVAIIRRELPSLLAEACVAEHVEL